MANSNRSSGDRLSARNDGDTLRKTVLAIGPSSVTLVVVARIARDAGLDTSTAGMERAAEAISLNDASILVVDGGADNRSCDMLIPEIERARAQRAGRMFRIVFLANSNQSAPVSGFAAIAHAVVAKPITSESLAPVLRNFRD